MKKLLFFLFYITCLHIEAQNNSLVVTTEDQFSNIPQNTNMVLVHARNGYFGTLWKLIPNDQTTPESADVRVLRNKSRYRKVSIGVSDQLTKTSLTVTEAPYIPLWSAGNTLGKSILFQRGSTLGINTITPTATLDVVGNGRTTGNFGIGTLAPTQHLLQLGDSNADPAITNANLRLGIGVGTGTAIQMDGSGPGENFNIHNAYGYSSLTTVKNINVFSGLYTRHSANTGFSFETLSGDFLFRKGSLFTFDTLFRIKSNGKVGIRRNPTYTLDVAGTMRADSNSFLAPNIGTGVVIGGTAYIGYKLDVDGWMRTKSNTFLASDGGNVGVGTITPGEKLTVEGNIRSNGAFSSFKNGSNSLSNHLYFANVANNKAYNWQLNADESAADFWGFLEGVGWSRLMTITATGRVGIGTASPATTLDVNGEAMATKYRVPALNTAPSSASDTGTLGEIRVTATHIYVCTASNTWVRAALATW